MHEHSSLLQKDHGSSINELFLLALRCDPSPVDLHAGWHKLGARWTRLPVIRLIVMFPIQCFANQDTLLDAALSTLHFFELFHSNLLARPSLHAADSLTLPAATEGTCSNKFQCLLLPLSFFLFSLMTPAAISFSFHHVLHV